MTILLTLVTKDCREKGWSDKSRKREREKGTRKRKTEKSEWV